jgi:hypothetical protein
MLKIDGNRQENVWQEHMEMKVTGHVKVVGYGPLDRGGVCN